MTGASASILSFDRDMTKLLEQQEERMPFLHPVWLRTWFSEFGEGCEPVILRSGDGDAAGFAPLMRVDERLTFIGDSSICDFMDFLVPANGGVREDLWRRIQAEEWSELDLWGLRDDSPTREAVKRLAAEAGYEVSEEQEAVAPRVALPSTWEEYLASLNRKDRHELRRKIRRLFDSGADVSFDVLTQQREVLEGIETFLDLHTRSRLDKTEFMHDGMAAFFRRMSAAMAAEGLVKLFMLYINQRPAACVLAFDAGNQLYMYNSGYDPDFGSLAVGLVSKALCLQWAIENGKSGLDFLRGDESYKYDLGAVDQQIYRLLIARPQ